MTTNITQKKSDRAGKIFAGVVIGGSILGTTAILLSAPYKAEYKVEPIAPVSAIEMDAEVVTPKVVAEPKKEPLAIAHQEVGVDFAGEASKAIEEGDMKSAFVLLRKSLHGSTPTVDVLVRIAKVGRDINELELAETALKDAEVLDPKAADVPLEMARIYMKKNATEAAHAAATRAITLDKDNAPAWNLVGRSAMEMSDWQRAEAALSRAAELDPLNAMYRNNLGLLFIRMKKTDAAIDELETAVELFEDDAPHFVFNNLGLAHEMAGNFEEARAAFEEALSVSPFYARAKVNLERVEKTIAKVEEQKAFETAKSLEPTVSTEESEGI